MFWSFAFTFPQRKEKGRETREELLGCMQMSAMIGKIPRIPGKLGFMFTLD